MIESQTRLRVGRGVDHSEGEAAQRLWRRWRWTLGHEAPPPLVSDGFGGHREAVLHVFGRSKRGGQRRYPGRGWHYLQVVKVKDDYHRLVGLRPRLIWGKRAQEQQPLPASHRTPPQKWVG